VFTKFRLIPGSNSPGRPEPTGGLYVIGTSGHTSRLGGVRRGDHDFSLAGDMLFYIDAHADPSAPVTLWDLRTGKKRQEASDEAIAAAPNGFVASVQNARAPHAEVLNDVAVDGSVTSLGSPFPAGQTYLLSVDSAGFVAYAYDGGQRDGIRSGSFTRPHRIRTLLKPGNDSAECGRPTTSYVACEVDAKTPVVRLYNLNGGVKAHSEVCGTSNIVPVAIGEAMAWIGCAPHYLYELRPGATVTRSAGTYADVPAISALGEIIVSSPSRQALIALTNATAQPHTLTGST
jgi:hypothetical protein